MPVREYLAKGLPDEKKSGNTLFLNLIKVQYIHTIVRRYRVDVHLATQKSLKVIVLSEKKEKSNINSKYFTEMILHKQTTIPILKEHH